MKEKYRQILWAVNSLLENTASIITITTATLKDKASYFAHESFSDNEMEILCDKVMMGGLMPDPVVFYL